MKYSYTFATLALAASAVTVYGAPLGDDAAILARSQPDLTPGHILAARLVNTNVDKTNINKNQSSNSNATYDGDKVNPNTTDTSYAQQTTKQLGNGGNFGGGAGYGGNGGAGAKGAGSDFKCGGGKRSLASRRAFKARRRGQQQNNNNNGNDSDSDDSDSDSDDDEGGSHNTSTSSKSDSHNKSSDNHSHIDISNSGNDNSKTYNGGGGGSSGGNTPQSVTGSNGGATSNDCVIMRRGLIAQERRDEASGLALLRSLGAMTERDVEDPLESLAARDVGYSARMLGVEGHAARGAGNARRSSSFIFDDGLARRDASGLAVRCAQGYEGCSLAMRREAEEMLREHARDLGFHF